VKALVVVAVLASFALAGAALGPMARTAADLDEAADDAFAASLSRSVYQALRASARDRAFAFDERANDGTPVKVQGLILIHDGVCDPARAASSEGAFVPPPVAIESLRRSDFAVFLPGTAPRTTADPIFVFPRPGGADADNSARASGLPGRDNRVAEKDARLPFEVRRVYRLADRPNKPKTSEPADRYGYALALRRATAPRIFEDRDGVAMPLPWTNGEGALDPSVFPPKSAAPHEGLYEVEVLVFRDFDPDPRSPRHDPVPGGRFAGLLAVGP
jgi:hypothetical protein